MPFYKFIRKFTDLKGLKQQPINENVDVLDEPDTPTELRNSLRSSDVDELLPVMSGNFAENSIQQIPVNQESDDEDVYSDAKSQSDEFEGIHLIEKSVWKASLQLENLISSSLQT